MHSVLASGQFWGVVRSALRDYGPPSPAAEAAVDARHLPNLWLGVSVESGKWAAVRLDKLAATTAGAVQFASCEPLLGPLDMRPWLGSGLDWVIAGGESGPRAPAGSSHPRLRTRRATGCSTAAPSPADTSRRRCARAAPQRCSRMCLVPCSHSSSPGRQHTRSAVVVCACATEMRNGRLARCTDLGSVPTTHETSLRWQPAARLGWRNGHHGEPNVSG